MSQAALYWIEPGSPADNFPPVETALTQPDGLLCFGGDLTPNRLLSAYRQGIFPWYSEGQPIMWWSPAPRCVLYPDQIVIRRSLRKSIRNAGFTFSMNQCFDRVINACAQPRDGDPATWITAEMQNAYSHLHRLGHAHSAEIWQQGQLVGGLYGIAIGRVFFGESMFSCVRDSSKVALTCLARFLAKGEFHLIDAQVTSSHMISMGACEIDRHDFTSQLDKYTSMVNNVELWQTEPVSTGEYIYDE